MTDQVEIRSESCGCAPCECAQCECDPCRCGEVEACAPACGCDCAE